MPQNLDPSIESLLRPFLDQSAPIRSIVTLGCESGVLPGGLAQQASVFSASESGIDLLLVPAHLLNEMMTPIAEQFSFRAAVAFLPPNSSSAEIDWRLRRSLFDRGLVCIGSIQMADAKALCFLASDAVQSLSQLDVNPRGQISMSTLTEDGRFANQMFRYQCVKFYALRHGLVAALPPWEGNQLFGLNDKSCAGLALLRLTFKQVLG